MPHYDLAYELKLTTLNGDAEVEHIQFNTSMRDPEKDRDLDDNRIYTNSDDPETIWGPAPYVDVLTIASSLDPFFTYTLDIWIDGVKITPQPLEPECEPNGTCTIEKHVSF